MLGDRALRANSKCLVTVMHALDPAHESSSASGTMPARSHSARQLTGSHAPIRDRRRGALCGSKTGARMKQASSRDVFNYWNERRGGRPAPDRSEIEPGAIRRALGDTFILAFDAGAEHPFRLAGTRVCALFC